MSERYFVEMLYALLMAAFGTEVVLSDETKDTNARICGVTCVLLTIAACWYFGGGE